MSSPPLRLDALVTPCSRPFVEEALAARAEDAARTGAVLVALCSESMSAREAAELGRAMGVNTTVAVDLNRSLYEEVCGSPLFRFATSSNGYRRMRAFGHGDRHIEPDTWLKRDIGLGLGRYLRWETVAFADDDMAPLDEWTFRSLLEMLADQDNCRDEKDLGVLPARGMRDTSALRHGQRFLGDHFASAAGAGWMLVRLHRRGELSPVVGFFPRWTSNEDLFFNYMYWLRGKLGIGPGAWQREFELFGRPNAREDDPLVYRRAFQEENGDFVWEVLYEHLMSRRPGALPPGEVWAPALARRIDLLTETIARLNRLGKAFGLTSPGSRLGLSLMYAARSVAFAREVHTSPEYAEFRLDPQFIQHWLGALLRDARNWRPRLSRLPQVSSVPDALVAMGIPRSCIFVAEASAPAKWHSFWPAAAIPMPSPSATTLTAPSADDEWFADRLMIDEPVGYYWEPSGAAVDDVVADQKDSAAQLAGSLPRLTGLIHRKPARLALALVAGVLRQHRDEATAALPKGHPRRVFLELATPHRPMSDRARPPAEPDWYYQGGTGLAISIKAIGEGAEPLIPSSSWSLGAGWVLGENPDSAEQAMFELAGFFSRAGATVAVGIDRFRDPAAALERLSELPGIVPVCASRADAAMLNETATFPVVPDRFVESSSAVTMLASAPSGPKIIFFRHRGPNDANQVWPAAMQHLAKR